MKKFYWFRLVFRNLCGITIVVVVWRHSHWSVALMLSLLYVSEEARSVLEEVRTEYRRVSKKHEVETTERIRVLLGL
jgi:hypothetical protein